MKITKSILSIILSLMTALSCRAIAGAMARPLFRGDVNDDGNYTMDDVVMIQKYIAKLCKFSPMNTLTADADGNGKIEMDDVTLLQKVIAQLATIPDQEIKGARLQQVYLQLENDDFQPGLNKPVKFVAKAIDGIAPKLYEFRVDDEVVQDYSENNILEYSFSQERVYKITVTVKDGAERTDERSYGFDPTLGFTTPQYITLEIDKSNGEPELGKPVKFVAQAHGGYAPYQYEFYIENEKIKGRSEDNTFEYTLTSAYSYKFNVLVYDSKGSYLGSVFYCYGDNFSIIRTMEQVDIVDTVPDTEVFGNN